MALRVQIQEKQYQDGTKVIHNLNFAARQGEFIAVVGPSGAGKTSLLNMVAGLDKHFAGDIQLQKAVADGAEAPSDDIAFMFQDSRLMPWLTAADNIRLALDGKTGTAITTDLLRQVELEGFENHFPAQLSGGMKRRVALARAFAVNPQLLLMDEPFQSLDAPTAMRLRHLLLSLWGNSKPIVLFVTHDLREAVTLADRILFLSARPATLLAEVAIDLPRPRKMEGDAVNQFCNDLIEKWPDLLSGSALTPVPPDGLAGENSTATIQGTAQ